MVMEGFWAVIFPVLRVWFPGVVVLIMLPAMFGISLGITETYMKILIKTLEVGEMGKHCLLNNIYISSENLTISVKYQLTKNLNVPFRKKKYIYIFKTNKITKAQQNYKQTTSKMKYEILNNKNVNQTIKYINNYIYIFTGIKINYIL